VFGVSQQFSDIIQREWSKVKHENLFDSCTGTDHEFGVRKNIERAIRSAAAQELAKLTYAARRRRQGIVKFTFTCVAACLLFAWDLAVPVLQFLHVREREKQRFLSRTARQPENVFLPRITKNISTRLRQIIAMQTIGHGSLKF
jgi:hypothetical protein